MEERPTPVPGAGEVRVRVHAAGINFADLLARQGLYPDAPPLPAVMGYELAGEIDELGEGVEGLERGQRVFGASRFGAQAEFVVTKAANVLPLREGWSFEEGAAFPVVYATAYAGLIRYGSLRAGERVLIQAAAGGVGIAATQIAKAHDAEVFGTASASKHEALRGFGVDHPIDYRSVDFAREIRRITGEARPLDLVLDGIGGASFRKGLSLLRPGGRLVGIGASAVSGGGRRNPARALATLARFPILHPLALMSGSRAFIGLNVLRLWASKGSLDELIEPLQQLVEAGRLRPVVAASFPLEQAADAHRFIEERRNVGKVVLTV